MSVESCPKCGSNSFYHDSKTCVNECLKCNHKWKKPTMKELMTGTVLDGSLEAARAKPLTEFSSTRVESEAVVREEEVYTFTPAFLSAVEQAWRTKSVQTYWKWICEPTAEGVSVTLRGTTKPHEFFPKDIIERMKYDPVREHYYVPRREPLGITEIPIYLGKQLITWDWTRPSETIKVRAKPFWIQQGAYRAEVGEVVAIKRSGYSLEESLKVTPIPTFQDVWVKVQYPSDGFVAEDRWEMFEEVSGDYSLSYGFHE